MRTIVVDFVDDRPYYLRLTIDDKWKITCGYPQGNRGGGYHGGAGKELRIYEGAGKEHQRACISGVASFWDEGMEPTRLLVDEDESVTEERHVTDEQDEVLF